MELPLTTKETYLINFHEIEEVLGMLKQHAAQEHPDKEFVPFWSLLLRGDELVIRATVSNRRPGPQQSVELVRQLNAPDSSEE